MTKRNERAAAPSRETAAHYPETIDHERTSNGADEVDSIALSTPRDFALWFARNGFRVFPLPPGEKESKVRWDRVATTDPEKIASWFDEDGGGANYGVPAALNGLVILDEDCPGALAEAGVEIGPTFTVRTSKGFHRYLQSDEDFSQSSPWDDVDVRARGYVVGPGSVNSKTGAVYELVDDRAPADLPAPVADALRTATALRDFSPIVDEIERPAVALSPAQTAYVERAVAGVLADLEALGDLGDGQRDDRGRGWDSGTYGLAARLVELSNAAGDVYPIERAREDFLARAPRDRKFTDSHVASKFDDALDDVGDRPAELPADEDPADDFGDLGGASAPGALPDRFPTLDLVELLHGEPEPEDWLLWPLVERGRSVSLTSAPKAGKSLLVLEAVLCAVTGRPVFGHPASDPIRVVYVDAENAPNDLRERIHSMGAADWDLSRLHYVSLPPPLALDVKADADALIAHVRSLRPDLVVLDTVSRFVDGEENDSSTWLALYRRFLLPLKGDGVAVLRLDHLGKDVSKGTRGSSAKAGDVDAGWELTYNPAHGLRALSRKLSRNGHGPELVTLDVRTDPVLRHVPSDDDFLDDAVERLVDALDELGIPREWGRTKAGDELRSHGVKFATDDLTAAVRQRKGGGPL